jgi:uncharacterized protein (TIGR02246 family)
MERIIPTSSYQEDEQMLRWMVDQAVSRINKGDLTAIDDFWDENADYVSIDGRLITGRVQMQAFFSEILSSNIGGVQRINSLDIRFLTPEFAIVDGAWTISSAHDEAGNDFPPINGRGVEIAQKRDGKWRFVATREMVVFKSN